MTKGIVKTNYSSFFHIAYMWLGLKDIFNVQNMITYTYTCTLLLSLSIVCENSQYEFYLEKIILKLESKDCKNVPQIQMFYILKYSVI